MCKLTPLLALFAVLVFSSVAEARTFTDSAGRKVEVPDKIERVMTAGPPASVLIYALAPEKLAGWVRPPTDAEKAFLLPAARALPTYGRLTGKGGTANIESVLAAKPDIIVDVGTINETYISLADKVQKQTGIPYVLIDGSFAKTQDTFRLVGDLIGVPERALRLAAYSQDTLKVLQDKLAIIPEDKRSSVYYGREPDGLETGLSGSINLEILDAVGARNVAAAAGKGGLTNVSLEQVLQWNPETIIAADAKFAAVARNNADWSSIKAVKTGRVVVTPSLPFGWFDSPPGINRLIGVRWLEHVLYPDQFGGDLRSDVRAFFKLFYQVDVTEQQLDALLADATVTR